MLSDVTVLVIIIQRLGGFVVIIYVAESFSKGAGVMNRNLNKYAGMLNVCFLKQTSRSRRGFTLIEIVAILLIISILAAVTIPLFHGRVDAAKWSEASASAGTIRTAVSVFAACHSVEAARNNFVNRKLDDTYIQGRLGIMRSDLAGTYFVASDYTITAIDSLGRATIRVRSSCENAPEGEKILTADGSWL